MIELKEHDCMNCILKNYCNSAFDNEQACLITTHLETKRNKYIYKDAVSNAIGDIIIYTKHGENIVNVFVLKDDRVIVHELYRFVRENDVRFMELENTVNIDNDAHIRSTGNTLKYVDKDRSINVTVIPTDSANPTYKTKEDKPRKHNCSFCTINAICDVAWVTEGVCVIERLPEWLKEISVDTTHYSCNRLNLIKQISDAIEDIDKDIELATSRWHTI